MKRALLLSTLLAAHPALAQLRVGPLVVGNNLSEIARNGPTAQAAAQVNLGLGSIATLNPGAGLTSAGGILSSNVVSVAGRTGSVTLFASDIAGLGGLAGLNAGAGLSVTGGILSANVTSVSGRAGAVTLSASDITGLGTLANLGLGANLTAGGGLLSLSAGNVAGALGYTPLSTAGGTLTGMLGSTGFNASGRPVINAPLIGNSFTPSAAMGVFNANTTSADATAHYGIIAGVNQTSGSTGYDVGGYFGLQVNSNAGNGWAQNSVLSVTPGATIANSNVYQGTEIDLNPDRAMTGGGLAPTMYGLTITGVSLGGGTGRALAGLNIGAPTPLFQNGVLLEGNGITGSGFYDTTMDAYPFECAGAVHVICYDTALAGSQSIAAFRMGNNQSFDAVNSMAANVELFRLDASNALHLGDGAASDIVNVPLRFAPQSSAPAAPASGGTVYSDTSNVTHILPVLGGSFDAPVLAAGGTAPVLSSLRASVHLTPEDFGAKGDCTTDDSGALNAYAAYVRASTGYQGLRTISLGSNRCYLVSSGVNWTGFLGYRVTVLGNGSTIVGATPGKAVISAQNSWILIRDLRVVSQGSDLYGIQLGTATTSGSTDNPAELDNVTVIGTFVNAPLLDRAAEGTLVTGSQFINQTAGGYALIMDGMAHWPFDTTYAPDSVPANSQGSFNEATFVNCRFENEATTGFSPAVWMANFNRHEYIDSYAQVASLSPVVVLYTAFANSTDVLTWDVHSESAPISEFFITGTYATPTLANLDYRNHLDQTAAGGSVFTLDTPITSATFTGLRIRVPAVYNAGVTMFDKPGKYSGSATVYTPSGLWNAAGGTFTGCVYSSTVACNLPLSIASPLTATGTNQATALALTANVNVVTNALAGTGTILPVATTETVISNQSGNALPVYPPVGAGIIGLAVNAPYSLPAYTSRRFIQINATTYLGLAG